MLKLAVSGAEPKFYEKYNLKEICKFIRSMGLNAIELVDLNIKPLDGEKSEIGVWTTRDIDYAKQILEEENCIAPVIQFRFAFNKEIGDSVERHIKEFKAAIDAAVKLGTKTVLHYLCFREFDRLNMDLVHKYLDEPLKYAESKKITLVLENEFENPAVYLPENMLAIMKEFNSPYFKTNYDAPNYHVAGCEGYPYAYNLLKEYIGYAHLKNVCLFKSEYNNEKYAIGYEFTGGRYKDEPVAFVSLFDGAVNMLAVLNRLDNDGYDGWITLEPHAELDLAIEDIKKDVKLLREYGVIK